MYKRQPTQRSNDEHSRTSLPTHDVLQQYSITYSSKWVCTCRVYRFSCWDFHCLTVPHNPGERPTRTRVGAFPHPPLAESGIGRNSIARNSENRCVGPAWVGRGTEGGRLTLCTGSYVSCMKYRKHFQRSTWTSLPPPSRSNIYSGFSR